MMVRQLVGRGTTLYEECGLSVESLLDLTWYLQSPYNFKVFYCESMNTVTNETDIHGPQPSPHIRTYQYQYQYQY